MLFFCFFVLPQFVSAKIKRDAGRKVLVLNSYHKGYEWSDYILESVEAEFEKSGIESVIVVEYMDMKYNDAEDIYGSLYELYKLKYSDVKFDVIISCDNSALDFLLLYRDELFKDAAIVFCGVNAFDESMIAGEKNIAGVAESLDVNQNIDMILRLYPDVKDIVVLCDIKNDIAYNEISSVFERYSERLHFTSIRGVTFDELAKHLRGLGNDCAILCAGFTTDVNGNEVTLGESYNLILDNTDAPVFCLWRSMLGSGFLGGIVCDSGLQGELAAKKAIRILSGESADETGVIKEGFNKPIFDYNVMKRFNLPISKLPSNSILLNEPESFYYHYKAYIWLVSGAFIVLSVSTFFLLVNVLRRVSAEKALRENQRRLRAIIDSSGDMAWLKDEHGRFITVNETYARICGLSVDDIVGRNDSDFWPGELAEKYVADDKRVMETGESLRVEELVQLSDGNALWVESIKTPIFDDNGKAIGTSGIGRDMTAHREAERALADERNLLRTLIDNLPDYIYTKDRDSKFSLCNTANISMFKCKSELEVIGKTDFDFFPAYKAAKWFAEEQEVMKTGKAFIGRQESSTHDGSTVWASVTKVPLMDNNGNITGLVGINTDITRLKNIEFDLQRAGEELERRVLERTSQLGEANEHLHNEIEIRKKAEEMLLASQKQLRSLASELSLSEERLRHKIATDIHDNIGQHLAISKIKLESLRENIGNGGVEEIGEILELITQTISLTRSLTFEISPPVLYELGFEPAMEWLVRNARKVHGLDAEFESDGEDKPMDNNIRVLLFQAVRELIVNIAKHGEASMVTVISEREGDQIKIRVIDDGVGFDVAQVRNKARSSKGFGLFSIRERLGFVGGTMEIDSQAGEGTKVILKARLKVSAD